MAVNESSSSVEMVERGEPITDRTLNIMNATFIVDGESVVVHHGEEIPEGVPDEQVEAVLSMGAANAALVEAMFEETRRPTPAEAAAMAAGASDEELRAWTG